MTLQGLNNIILLNKLKKKIANKATIMEIDNIKEEKTN